MGDKVSDRRTAEIKIVDYARAYVRAARQAEEFRKSAVLLREAQIAAIARNWQIAPYEVSSENPPWTHEAKEVWSKYLTAAQRKGRYLALLKKTVAQLEAAIADPEYYD